MFDDIWLFLVVPVDAIDGNSYFFLKLKSIQDEHFWGCSWIEGRAKRAASLKSVANSPQ